MNKIMKIMSVVAMMILVICMSNSVQAYNNEDVISYITKAHTVNGTTLQITESVAQRLTQFLKDNPVTDAKADIIIAKLEEAKAVLGTSNSGTLEGVDNAIKAEVIRLVKEAGKEAGLSIEVDTINNIVTVKDLKGNVIVSAKSYAQYFVRGNNNNNNNNNTGNTEKPGNSNSANGGTSVIVNNNNNNTNNNSNSNSSNGTKLVYTGNDFSFVIKTILAIVAMASIGMVVKKYAK